MSDTATGHSQPLDRNTVPPILRGDDDTVSLAKAALSSDTQPTGHEGSGDIIEREQMFERFLSILTVGIQHIVSCLIGLAIGGIEGHWVLGLGFIVLATMCALAGAYNKAVGFKPGGALLALEMATWLILA